MADNLGIRVKRALQDTHGPLWFPELTADLANAAWIHLERDVGLRPDSYGTARLIDRDPSGARQIEALVSLSSEDSGNRRDIPVELLPSGVARRWAGPGVRFLNSDEILGAQDCVQDALRILDSVPSVGPTICSLARSLHLFDTGDDEVDRSFSEPGLLFSIFVSIPGPDSVARELRVAEAILHEVMHLQLTLVEAFVPLVGNTEKTYFSPWRDEYRTAQGVLHALYVFRLIDAFMGALSLDGPSYVASSRHAQARREMIAHQVQEISEFRDCTDLTDDGVAFVERLLS